jgi:hypothetical protein
MLRESHGRSNPASVFFHDQTFICERNTANSDDDASCVRPVQRRVWSREPRRPPTDGISINERTRLHVGVRCRGIREASRCCSC